MTFLRQLSVANATDPIITWKSTWNGKTHYDFFASESSKVAKYETPLTGGKSSFQTIRLPTVRQEPGDRRF